MANTVRQYVGARYVPKFADPVAWASGTSYEALTIVTYNNASYTSKIPVPATVGNPADNPTYWALTGNYNAQVEAYRKEATKAAELANSVQENLDSEITARKKNYISVIDYGADNTGNNASDEAFELAMSAASNNDGTLYIPYGTYLINSSHTFNTEVLCDGLLTNNGTLTFNKLLYAEPKQIFATTNISFNRVQTGYVEWFNDAANAAFQDAINLLNHVKLLPKLYTINSTVYINKNGFILEGTEGIVDFGYPTQINLANNSQIHIGSFSASNQPRNITLRNLFIGGNADAGALQIDGVYYLYLTNINIIAYTGKGLWITRAVHSILYNVSSQCNSEGQTCFNLDGRYTSWGFAGTNASLYFIACAASGSASNVVGWTLYGKGSDTFLLNCECSNCSAGIIFDLDNSKGDFTAWDDILIDNFICDAFTNNAIYSSLEVEGKICINNLYASTTTTNAGILLNNSTVNLLLSNYTFNGSGYALQGAGSNTKHAIATGISARTSLTNIDNTNEVLIVGLAGGTYTKVEKA